MGSDSAPHARLLSNGRYTVLLTGAGTGCSAWDGLLLTGWSADRIEDPDGLFLYVRDLERGTLWSLGHQPVQHPPDGYAVRSRDGVLHIARRDGDIDSSLEVCVAPADDVEIRRLRLRNTGSAARRLEVTSWAEVVLHDAAAHAAHPAFSKLFVQTEYVPEAGALLARRRPRSRTDRVAWMVHTLAGDGPLDYDTDRARVLGRGRTAARPRAFDSTAPLARRVGSVLDPVLCLRRSVVLAAGASAELTLLLGAAETRAAALALRARHATATAVAAVFARAADSERALRRRLGVSREEAARFDDLAGALLYGHPVLRGGGDVRPAGGRHAGARPLVIVDADTPDGRAYLGEILKAHAYWRAKRLDVDLLILCDDPANGRQTDEVEGHVRIRRRADVPDAQLDALLAGARAVLSGPPPALVSDATRVPSGRFRPASDPPGTDRRPGEPLLLDNGYGGFTADGGEYVIRLDPRDPSRARPPMPWVNVVANQTFGFLVSEAGAGYTWSRNSREHRLTPWYNDPVADPYGEALYVRDQDAGVFWSPLPGPVPSPVSSEVRHGFGYSLWRQSSQDLEQEVCLFVARQEPVKVIRLRLTNTSGRPRRLALFSYARLVLGVLPTDGVGAVVTAFDAETATLLARNPLSGEFADGVVFAAAVAPAGAPVHCTGDRTAFLGRNGSPAAPAALSEDEVLDGRTGAGLDPCAALQVTVVAEPGRTVTVAFLLGETTDEAEVRKLVRRYRQPGAIERALSDARAGWRHTLSTVRVETPSPALDLMLNGWLGYQNLGCRLWGRSAFYQSGGAFGFRDQLQDAAALVYARPDLTRAQILLHAAHQFVEGDVLHWWHPPAGRGTRTRFSDDLLWLPYVTAFYVRTTGDRGVLDEPVGFVTARPLAGGEDEAYLFPSAADEVASVYAHCCRALDRSLTRGRHGLPLMGTGDWNDGMNRVGREGRGESVWLGFFLYAILGDFIPLCERRRDRGRARRYRTYRTRLRAALERTGWDGAWYRRAYYDDGTPLGSASSDECRIDALAQAWAVISRAAPRARAARAMDAVERELVDEDAGLIRLLTPPFDRTSQDPGYIKGYVPGIRENGGQYTHAALWVVRALAELGRRDRAAALLEMLLPVHHARSAPEVAVYQVEPYVVAADVYGVPPHLGRGGWTWYTGSAGWMYRVALESVLGLTLAGDTLRLAPRIPDGWPGFRLMFRLPDGKTRYELEVRNPRGRAAAVTAVRVDGRREVVGGGAARIRLRRDGAVHRVTVTLGATPRRPR